MRILAIDQALTTTGIAVIEGGQFVVLEALKPRSKGYQRVDAIVTRCLELAKDADLVALEQPALSVRGSASTGALFGLFGVLSQALWQAGKEPIVINSSHRAGYATGNGAANKDQFLAWAYRRYTDERIDDNNIADAAVMGSMVARLVGEPVAAEGDDMPAANLDFLNRIVVPSQFEHLICPTYANSRAWESVRTMVTKGQLAAIRALPGANARYAKELVEYAKAHGYVVYRNQASVGCTRRLDDPSHSCGAVRCTTEWATPAEWEYPVLLRAEQGDGWAILSQPRGENGDDAPIGQGRKARLHTSTPVAVLA